MSRPIDPLKMERLKEAVIEMVVEYGYKGVDIKGLSQKTGISAGYLYKYYKNKEELILDTIELYVEEFANGVFSSIQKCKNLKDVITVLNNDLYEIEKNSLIFLQFIIKLFFDPTLEKLKSLVKKNISIASILENSIDNKELSKLSSEIVLDTIIHLSLTLMHLKIEYINNNKKEFILSKEEVIEKVYEMTLIAIQ